MYNATLALGVFFHADSSYALFTVLYSVSFQYIFRNPLIANLGSDNSCDLSFLIVVYCVMFREFSGYFS